MNYTLFIIIYGRDKVICYCYLNFLFVRFFKIIYDVFWIWSNFTEIFFNIWYFISITITFIFNTIVSPKIVYSYCFMIIVFFFFTLKKIQNISEYSIFNCFSFLFLYKKICVSLIAVFFFQSKKISYIFNYSFFFRPYNFHYNILWKALENIIFNKIWVILWIM